MPHSKRMGGFTWLRQPSRLGRSGFGVRLFRFSVAFLGSGLSFKSCLTRSLKSFNGMCWLWRTIEGRDMALTFEIDACLQDCTAGLFDNALGL